MDTATHRVLLDHGDQQSAQLHKVQPAQREPASGAMDNEATQFTHPSVDSGTVLPSAATEAGFLICAADVFWTRLRVVKKYWAVNSAATRGHKEVSGRD